MIKRAEFERVMLSNVEASYAGVSSQQACPQTKHKPLNCAACVFVPGAVHEASNSSTITSTPLPVTLSVKPQGIHTPVASHADTAVRVPSDRAGHRAIPFMGSIAGDGSSMMMDTDAGNYVEVSLL